MKLVREYINEKFSEEDGDPIADLNIGIMKEIKDFFNKNNYRNGPYADWIALTMSIDENMYEYIKYFINSEYVSRQDKITGFRYAINHNKFSVVKLFLDAGFRITDAIGPKDVLDIRRSFSPVKNRKILKLIDDAYPRGKLPESVNEKFSEDSDPIDDMNIGTRHLIKEWLDQNFITNYRIKKDGTISVYTSVNLNSQHLGNFPKYIQFDKIYGNFDISHNELTSMRGCPIYVKRSFWCVNNKLTSLEYAPKKVAELFCCWANPVKFTWKAIWRICEVGEEILADNGHKSVNTIIESVNEKFEQESDPIKDMGIGNATNLYDKALKLSPDPHVSSHHWVDYYEIQLPGKHISGYFKKSDNPESDYKSTKLEEREKIYKDLIISNVTSYFVDCKNKRHIFIKNQNDNKEYYVCPDEQYIIHE
jgi:hypothetical protein